MLAMVCVKYGTSDDALELRDVDKPAPKDDEVLVKVHASSINSWDWDLIRGKPFITRLGGLTKPPYPILGADVAGRVEAVGRKVKRLRPGDEVLGDVSGCGWGGFAEYVCAREHVLSPKPAGMTFEQAASIPQASVLALQGLRDKGRIRRGMQVLINGAGGGVGTFAVQIARYFGAEVSGVDRGDKLELIRFLGARRAVDYRKEDITIGERRYDLILDVAGYRSIFDWKRVLNPRGTYVMLGGSMGRIGQTILAGPWITLSGGGRMGVLFHKPKQEDQQFVTELCESGRIQPVIDRTYPLTGVAEALRYLGEGHVKGKVVIRMDV